MRETKENRESGDGMSGSTDKERDRCSSVSGPGPLQVRTRSSVFLQFVFIFEAQDRRSQIICWY